MRNFVLRLIANAVALYIAARVIPGIHVSGDLGALALVALIFGLVNALIGPILRFLSCPLVGKVCSQQIAPLSDPIH